MNSVHHNNCLIKFSRKFLSCRNLKIKVGQHINPKVKFKLTNLNVMLVVQFPVYPKSIGGNELK